MNVLLKLEWALSKLCKLEMGVQQGGILIPALFSIKVNNINNNNVYMSCAHSHQLPDCLSDRMIHINLNMIFCTHVEHSPTKAIYIKYCMEKDDRVEQRLRSSGVNSKCGVESKRRCKSHESCICIFGFSVCGCQKKNVVYETEYRHVAVQRDKQDQNHL